MASLNDTVIIARSALLAHQERLAVTSHNIANVDTPGYHRRKVALATNPPLEPSKMEHRHYSVGTGVRVSDIMRAYNGLKEAQLRGQIADTEYHARKQAALEDLEAILSGMGDASLASHLQQFWNAWQDVANNADSMSYRSVLLERSESLAEHIRALDDRLGTVRNDIAAGAGPTFTGMVAQDVDEVNRIASQIQDINARASLVMWLYDPHSLEDQRGQLLNRLSEIVNISVSEDWEVTIDGQVLINADGSVRNDLLITSTATPMTFELDGAAVDLSGSASIGAWMDVATEVESLNAQLDTVASTLITEVNALHVTGFDLDANAGANFFVGADAGSIGVNVVDPRRVAAAATTYAPGVPNPGDGAVALAIADLTHQTFAATGDQTLTDYYSSALAALGARIDTERTLAEDGEVIVDMLDQSIQTESGVNLDEEMIDMLSAQRAYEAAARVLATVDGLLDLIINRM